MQCFTSRKSSVVQWHLREFCTCLKLSNISDLWNPTGSLWMSVFLIEGVSVMFFIVWDLRFWRVTCRNAEQMESVGIRELFRKSMLLDTLMTGTEEIKNSYFRVELEQGEKSFLQGRRKSEMMWAFSILLKWSNVLAKKRICKQVMNTGS